MTDQMTREELLGAIKGGEKMFMVVDFPSIDLSGLKLEGISFHGCTFKNANMSNCVLVDCSFYGSEIDAANLSGLKSRGSAFTASTFINSNLKGAVFSDDSALNSDFRGAICTDAKMQFRIAANCDFSSCNLENCDFSNVNLQLSDFTKANLMGVNFTGANLKRTIGFSSAYYTNYADFTGTVLEDVGKSSQQLSKHLSVWTDDTRNRRFNPDYFNETNGVNIDPYDYDDANGFVTAMIARFNLRKPNDSEYTAIENWYINNI